MIAAGTQPAPTWSSSHTRARTRRQDHESSSSARPYSATSWQAALAGALADAAGAAVVDGGAVDGGCASDVPGNLVPW